MNNRGRMDYESPSIFDSITDDALSGYRLHRLEVFNWGTFDQRVWSLKLGGRNSLVTGDIGSGKTTLVDAVTTLLVPPHRVAYNKAAGAQNRERMLRSYVLGYYKTERGDTGVARPVPLRDRNSYTVIVGVFRNEDYQQTVSLAEVFWITETRNQPERFFAAAERDLTISRTSPVSVRTSANCGKGSVPPGWISSRVSPPTVPGFGAVSESKTNKPWTCFTRPSP